MRKVIGTCLVVASLYGCTGQETNQNPSGEETPSTTSIGQTELWKFELMKEDRAFGTSVQLDDPSKWSAFLAPDGTVLQSGVGEIQGPEAVEHMFTDAIDSATVTSLRWEPERAEVSRTGDLGYTVGRYLATGIDLAGNEITKEGTYVTIWRRQDDGEWKVETTLRAR